MGIPALESEPVEIRGENRSAQFRQVEMFRQDSIEHIRRIQRTFARLCAGKVKKPIRYQDLTGDSQQERIVSIRYCP
jgi:hypothetical protein